jgi:SH3 domain-containing YSC84-like protein 1
MKRTSSKYLVAVACLLLALPALAMAQDPKSNPKLKDPIEQSDKAAHVLKEIMDTPDKGIPKGVLDDAECVLVFPQVVKAGFIVGGKGGRGVASCRTANGSWSAPAYFNIGGGSFGLQIGAAATDLILLFMNKDGLNSLLSDKFQIGGEASAAAGPVGREAQAGTDIKMGAKILSYSRSKGVFGGLALNGSVIKPDKDDMKASYGSGYITKNILTDPNYKAPDSIRALPKTLGTYSLRKPQ